ncbi:MAG TPA: tetratricopeptide repeat protein [Pyrinomonadaceae bacterium]|jgi:tetratricopeptide (TPR) repeat protein|nr:tetratricopeptide repeat protein [Pyrinomonadaceae bacterium]
MRASLSFVFAAATLLLAATALPAVAQQSDAGKPRIERSGDPLSHDPRRPNPYDIDNELRNSKIGREAELALIEGNQAFSATPQRLADAEKAFLRAAKLEPRSAKAYVGLGVVYAAQNDAEKAKTAFEKAVEVKPKYAEAHFNLALIYSAIGKKTEAHEQLRLLQGLDAALAKRLAEMISK